jgi:hypothetical protein
MITTFWTAGRWAESRVGNDDAGSILVQEIAISEQMDISRQLSNN